VAQIPSIGRIVQYSLAVSDAEQIMRRRTNSVSIADRIKGAVWPVGAQAHIGNPVAEGDTFPMLITRVWGPNEDSLVNGQVFLDGNDVFWVMSVKVGEGPGTFSWPART
jgi:hypothetical protein